MNMKKIAIRSTMFAIVLCFAFTIGILSTYAQTEEDDITLTADKMEIERGDIVTITWNFPNYNGEIGISYDDEILKMNDEARYGSGSIYFELRKTTTFVFKTLGDNPKTKSITIKVLDNSTNVSIDAFDASKYIIKKGEITRLSWKTRYDKSLKLMYLKDRKINIKGKNSIYVKPEKTTTYTLYAEDGDRKESASITIFVENINNKEVKICKFFSSRTYHNKVSQGSYLNWHVENAYDVRIGNYNNLPSSGSMFVSPAKTTVYTLTAKDIYGREISQEIEINVEGSEEKIIEPEIYYFETLNYDFKAGDKIYLDYAGENFVEATIKDDTGKVIFTSDKWGDGVSVYPKKTTTYTLVLKSEKGEVSKSFTVNMIE